MKINQTLPWSFEEDNADLLITSNIEFIEYRSSNIGFANAASGHNGNSVPGLSLNRINLNRYGNVSNDGNIS